MSKVIAIAGGGAAGVFAAIACAERLSGGKVVVLEKSRDFLSKVRISGGGRCNVTHACFDPQRLSESYPRGRHALIGPFHQFQPRDSQAWFESRGVKLKAEPDGRIFPVSDSSATIVDCLLQAARDAGVDLRANLGVEIAAREPGGGFRLTLTGGETMRCDRLMLALGGCRAPAAANLAMALGHSLVPPVPSLFAFQLNAPWLTELAGVSVRETEVTIPGRNLRQSGPLLITHGGISGPAVLRLSSWAARELHAANYRFTARVNWLPHATQHHLNAELHLLKTRHAPRRVSNTPLPPLPARLWEALVKQAGIGEEKRWADVSRASLHAILQQLVACDLAAVGKSLNKEEFVTCGGIPLREVNFKTMESRICPGLFFGGELLDIDGLTGGFNFQAAWTTGWLAGRAMSRQTT
jgi:predicted Rossmann fold flavoprotein